MAVLYVGKMPVAARMQSRSLRAEAIESQLCELQDLTILIGLGRTVSSPSGGPILCRPCSWSRCS